MFRLSFTYMITGMAGFVLFQVLSLVAFGSWAADNLHSMDGLFRVHLLLLGWGTMIAMGAVYQLISVVLQANVYSITLGYIQYFFFAGGTFGLTGGFYASQLAWIAISALFVFTGILLFAWNVGMTLYRAKHWDVVSISAACAVVYLVLTGVTGTLMGIDFSTGVLGGFHQGMFGAHIWLGTLGWFGLLITGFSYKMLPMFYLSHNYPKRLQIVVLALWNGSVLLGALSFLFQTARIWNGIALLLIVLAVAFYNVHIRQIMRHRHKQKPGSGILWTVYSSTALGIYGVGLLVYCMFYPEQALQAKTVSMSGWVYLWGWVGFSILGYMSKIVPFLWWTQKYGPRVGKTGTPTMGEMIKDRQVGIWLGVIAFFLLLLLVGIGTGQTVWTAVGGCGLAAGSLVYLSLTARVFTR